MNGLIRNYGKLSDAQLDVKAQAIIVSLTNNAYFPTPSPTVAEFTTLKENFSVSLSGCAGRDRTAIALKNQAREVLLNAMKLLALNIDDTAKGDTAKMISSGFDLSGNGENVPPLSAPTGLKVTDGLNPGEIRISVTAVPRAASYIHEYTQYPVTPDSIWNPKVSTSREVLITGLPSGVRFVFRTKSVGHKDQEACSESVSRVVQ